MRERLKLTPASRKGTQSEHRRFSPYGATSTLLALVPLAQQIAVGLAGLSHVPKTDGLALSTEQKTKQLLH